MKKSFLLLVSVILLSCSNQKLQTRYKSLNPSEPIIFNGDYIIYDNKKIDLGPTAFFIDGQLSDKDVANFKYVFNSVNEASQHLTDGHEDSPMVLYIAPYVYWIDNPDDPEIRLPEEIGGTPIGLKINCNWLKFQGLSSDPKNVILACNRGQTMGAKGNFTMLEIIGDGTSAENITFGNYCNVDLEYTLKKELNRKKRGSAIVQAQLAFCRGDKIFAKNSRFISRLNLVPFYGGKRTLFDHCHFESTDDALATEAVYLDCTFNFYSSKPFGHTEGTGSVFLNCDIQSYTRGEQYLVKGRGQMVAVDSKMNSKLSNYWGWKEKPALKNKNYHFNNQLNGKNISIDTHHQYASVDMTEKSVLNAYRIKYNNKVIYNTYNLLKGDDNWDPMGIKSVIDSISKESDIKLYNIPVELTISSTQDTIETGKDNLLLTSHLLLSGGKEIQGDQINWNVNKKYKNLVKLKDNKNGTCQIIPTNKNDETIEVLVDASTESGLEATYVLNVKPKFIEAPEFITKPQIIINNKGILKAQYKLKTNYKDQSSITWYRCSDSKGANAIPVAVSRENNPKYNYKLSQNDIGYFIMVTVEPKHIRCHKGKAEYFILNDKISEKEINNKKNVYSVDLKSLPTFIQSNVIPGFWTVDCFKPKDTNEYKDWKADNSTNSWFYGTGVNGAASDTGLIQGIKGARIRYTPVGEKFNSMKVNFTACPAKTAGQGFSSAKAQYMDIFIKMDNKNMNGYALRLVRTTKYHDAIDCVFVKYTNGIASPISDPVSTSCYRTACFITLEIENNLIKAHLETPSEYYIEPDQPEVVQIVDMETKIKPNIYGGFGLQHTGTVRSGATLIKDLRLEWNL